MHKRLWVLILIFVFSRMAHVNADEHWIITLFNEESQTLLQIDANGNQVFYPLRTSGAQRISSDVAVDGSLAAFCAVMNSDDVPQTRVYVLDFVAGEVLLEDTLEDDECNIRPASLHDGLLAVGRLSRDFQDWWLDVYDISTGGLAYTLDELTLQQNPFSLMPYPKYLDDTTLIFAMVNWGTEGQHHSPAFRWTMADGEISQEEIWGMRNLVYLPETGEFVWTALDPNLPAGSAGGPALTNNVVKYRNKAGEVLTIFHSVDFLPVDVQFIDDGQAVAIHLIEAFAGTDVSGIRQSKWVRLGREGGLRDLTDLFSGFSQIVPAPDGYIYLEQSYSDEDGAGGQVRLKWITSERSATLFDANDGTLWRIVHYTPLSVTEGTAPFVAVE